MPWMRNAHWQLKIDWLDFPVDDILQQFTTLRKDSLESVQTKSSSCVVRMPCEKAQITVLLPHSCSFSEWSEKVDCMPHSWPKSFNIDRMQMPQTAAVGLDDVAPFSSNFFFLWDRKLYSSAQKWWPLLVSRSQLWVP